MNLTALPLAESKAANRSARPRVFSSEDPRSHVVFKSFPICCILRPAGPQNILSVAFNAFVLDIKNERRKWVTWHMHTMRGTIGDSKQRVLTEVFFKSIKIALRIQKVSIR